MIKYADSKYGKSNLISYSNDEKNKKSTGVFKDLSYGFKYTVTTDMNPILVDGTSFGETSSITDNYSTEFLKYIKDKVKKQLEKISIQCNFETEYIIEQNKDRRELVQRIMNAERTRNLE